ncbi:unnamed protein product [Prorocentrum cordatum]|uniref:Cyclic nucleotide-binding domain-containing protein n=1 Tax=Prorocentrum cordatum TaxID=2364126 RepID=A0ABN9UZU0_9DINO|nr:unnamed protein product [Polarella glacialis]
MGGCGSSQGQTAGKPGSKTESKYKSEAKSKGTPAEEKQEARRKNAEYIGILTALERVPLLKRLPKDQHPILAACCVTKVYKEGQLCIKQGDLGNELFLIRSGEAVVLIDEGNGGKPKQVNTVREGDYFGENALLHDEPRSAPAPHGHGNAGAAGNMSKTEKALQAALAELEQLRKQVQPQGDSLAGSAMAVDLEAEGDGEGEAHLAAEVKALEAHTVIAKQGHGSWAEEQQRVLAEKLALARKKLLDSKPLHTHVQALASQVKAGAAKVAKAEGCRRKLLTSSRGRRLEEAEKDLVLLQQQQAQLEGEPGPFQASLGRAPEPTQQADFVMPSLGVPTEALESIVLQLTEGPSLSGDAKKRLVEGIGGQIN